jgi:hypothetical protein
MGGISQASLGGLIGFGVAAVSEEVISFSSDAAEDGVLALAGRGQFHSGLRLKLILTFPEEKLFAFGKFKQG